MFKKVKEHINLSTSAPVIKVLGNTGWLVTDRVLRMIIGLLVAAWVARFLGPNQYGILNFAIALVATLSVVSTLGLEQLIVREIVKNPIKRDELLGTAFLLKIGGGIIVFLLAIIVMAIIRPNDSVLYTMVLIIASGTIFQAFDVVEFFFRSQTEAKYIVIARGIGFLLINILKVILIITNSSIIAFAWAAFLEIALGSIGLIIAYNLYGKEIRNWKAKFETAKQLLSESWYLILSSMAIIIYMKIDQIMIGQMVGDTEVGFYSAAVKLSEVWYLIPIALVQSVAPSITRSYNTNLEKYNSRLQKLYNLMSLTGILVAIPVSIFSGSIINRIYGDSYSLSASILTIHIWSGLIVGWGLVRNLSLITENLLKIILVTSLSGTASNIILNFFLIPLLKGQGAAIATLLSQVISVNIIILFFKKTRYGTIMQLKSLYKIFDIKPE